MNIVIQFNSISILFVFTADDRILESACFQILDEIPMNFNPSWTDPNKLLHYAKYAEATYASKLMMIHPRKYCGNFCNILSNLICPIFCCFPTCSKPGYVFKDSCCLSDTAVLKSLVSPKSCDIKNRPLFVNYESSAKDITKLKTPFAVIEDTHDKENKAIVITIRGTSQPADLLIDALAKPELIWDEKKNFLTLPYFLTEEQQQTLMDDKEDDSWKKFEGNRWIKNIDCLEKEKIKILLFCS